VTAATVVGLVSALACLIIRHGTGSGATQLVDGRITVRVPEGWSVRRVTGGLGSARVEVASPADPDAVLHITQADVPSGELADTAAALRSAADAQPPGVFVDFNPDDRRAGRPAVTYREVRSGHDIRWTVVVAGQLRISIGCQSAPAGFDSIAAACEQAVGTAREIR